MLINEFNFYKLSTSKVDMTFKDVIRKNNKINININLYFLLSCYCLYCHRYII